jgi:hypothetical protein
MRHEGFEITLDTTHWFLSRLGTRVAHSWEVDLRLGNHSHKLCYKSRACDFRPQTLAEQDKTEHRRFDTESPVYQLNVHSRRCAIQTDLAVPALSSILCGRGSIQLRFGFGGTPLAAVCMDFHAVVKLGPSMTNLPAIQVSYTRRARWGNLRSSRHTDWRPSSWTEVSMHSMPGSCSRTAPSEYLREPWEGVWHQ